MPAYYRAKLSDFVVHSETEIVGTLAIENSKAKFPLETSQIEAWREQLPDLKAAANSLIFKTEEAGGWSILLEYPIPRVGLRIDAVLLTSSDILVMEFKTGGGSSGAVVQSEEYALSLACFHEGSHGRRIVPIAVTSGKPETFPSGDPLICGTVRVPSKQLKETLLNLVENPSATGFENKRIVAEQWDHARFRPVPSIVEAAVALYGNMNVFEIGHSAAAQETLEKATAAIRRAVATAKKEQSRIICFVTGVPGSGKTLVGLNAVHDAELKDKASFFSGNSPLVRVLKNALIEAEVGRTGCTAKQAALRVRTFIHNVHHFAEEYYDSPEKVPSTNVVVFDEAQRAWNLQRNLQKFKRAASEPEMLLGAMERVEWCVIVALVGGGQEINRGEAGLSEWGRALCGRRDKWTIVAGPELFSEEAGGTRYKLFVSADQARPPVKQDADLHLKVSVRSIKNELFADWVECVLSGDSERAAIIARHPDWKPIFLTRNLETAREWLRRSRRGYSRSGLVGSAYAVRLRFDGLEYSQPFHARYQWDKWFLKDARDVRSSSALEVMATQFEVQGLELDWVCVCWGDDLVWDGSRWVVYRVSYAKTGTTWKEVRKYTKKGAPDFRYTYSVNGYRVLLTRARRQSIIYIPSPPAGDRSRQHAGLNLTAEYFISCGANLLGAEKTAAAVGS